MKFNTLEEKCKYFQSISDHRLMPNSYVLVHCDGRAFSSLIKKKFEQPFDSYFIFIMNETARYLCENVGGCKMAYVQSDEITLVLTDFDTETTDSFFGYRMCKLISTIAALATAKFNRLWVQMQENIELSINTLPLVTFDCKVWNVPSYNDVKAWLIYRQNDCVRNSINQTASSVFSHKELEGLKTQERLVKLLEEKNIDWDNFNDGVKYGRFVCKEPITVINKQSLEKTERYAWHIHNAFKITDNKEQFDDLNIIPRIEN